MNLGYKQIWQTNAYKEAKRKNTEARAMTEPDPQRAPLGEPYPQPHESIILPEGAILPAGRRYHFLQEPSEDVTIRNIAIQYAAVALSRRHHAGDKIRIEPQEVQLAKTIGITAEIDDAGGIDITLHDGMGS